MEETDAAHGITIAELVEKLAAVGIAAERKSLYDDEAGQPRAETAGRC